MLFTYLRSFSFAHPQPVLLLARVNFQLEDVAVLITKISGDGQSP